MLADGHYRTKNGSDLWLKGGTSKVEFDWVEEPGACCDCEVEPYPTEDGYLIWYCLEHENGSAKLFPVEL